MSEPPGQRFQLKLKGLREHLRIWNKEVFGDIGCGKKGCLDNILRWDGLEGEVGLDSSDIAARREAQRDLERILEMEEILWRQKSRIQWSKEGDQNTKFFYKIASIRRSINYIHSLRIGDEMEENVEVIKAYTEEYFLKQFWEDRPLRPKMDGLSLPRLGEDQADWLERPFDEEEVKVVWILDGDKALGPDGFTITFYKACWEVIKEDLMLVFHDFHEKCFLDKGSNATYIALIPNREGVDQLSDFRPISLVGSTYKIISKCLTILLKEVLSGIVLREQGAFLQGRIMTDGVLCAKECIDARIQDGRPGVF